MCSPLRGLILFAAAAPAFAAPPVPTDFTQAPTGAAWSPLALCLPGEAYQTPCTVSIPEGAYWVNTFVQQYYGQYEYHSDNSEFVQGPVSYEEYAQNDGGNGYSFYEVYIAPAVAPGDPFPTPPGTSEDQRMADALQLWYLGLGALAVVWGVKTLVARHLLPQ